MDQVYRQALDIDNRLKSYLDMPNDPAALKIRESVRHLIDMIQQKKDILAIEYQTQDLKSKVLALREDTVMDYGDSDDIKDRCDELIQALRKLRR